jgi:aldose 1-epimerase
MKIKSLIPFVWLMVVCSCAHQTEQLTKSGLNPENFKAEVDGKSTNLYTLVNKNGVEACITNYGGRLVSLMLPDKDGKFIDVVLGHDSIADYVNIDGNFGALIGRYGNRINQGRFSLDGQEYQLPQNDFGHCLHGGPKGFHHAVWEAEQQNDTTLNLKLFSPDGEFGFPGNVNVTVVYTLTHDNAINIAYKATTDAPTILNLTNHSYFNLSGNPSNDILDETVWFDADGFTPIDSTFMTSGEIVPVVGTPFDFTTAKTIGKDLSKNDEQLNNGRGYDHNMVLRSPRDISKPAAIVTDSVSGIKMEMFTNEPGIQFYIGNFLDGTVKGKKGIAYPHRSAICLESQHYPDSPNKAQWPSVVIRPGETYSSNCIYKFTTL